MHSSKFDILLFINIVQLIKNDHHPILTSGFVMRSFNLNNVLHKKIQEHAMEMFLLL